MLMIMRLSQRVAAHVRVVLMVALLLAVLPRVHHADDASISAETATASATERAAVALSCFLKEHWLERQAEFRKQVPMPPDVDDGDVWTSIQYHALASVVNYTGFCQLLDRQRATVGLDMVLSSVDMVHRDALVVAGTAVWLTASRASAVSAPPGWCRLPAFEQNDWDLRMREGGKCCNARTTKAQVWTTWGAVHAAHTYLSFIKHVVGQWVADRGFKDLSRIAASFHDGVASQFTHGIIWQTLLRRIPQPFTLESVRLLAAELCCEGCAAQECNARCATGLEGDWYHACFHGVGHGGMLLALRDAGVSIGSACEPARWLSLPVHRDAMLRGVAVCETVPHPNRKWCLTGAYMSYFEFIRPSRVDWSVACEQVPCMAACIMKCRQFASDLIDPVFTIARWPTAVVCYGPRLLSRDRAFALDNVMAPYSEKSFTRPDGGPYYTAEFEALLVHELGLEGEAATERCFS